MIFVENYDFISSLRESVKYGEKNRVIHAMDSEGKNLTITISPYWVKTEVPHYGSTLERIYWEDGKKETYYRESHMIENY